MRDEYDFSNAKRAQEVPHLAQLQAENTIVGKSRITIFLDDDILKAFRDQAAQSGKGYQTLINEALRVSLSPESAPLTAETLRKILHEELSAA
jgi:uncharacterized protein (DUF4415 family)